ncbi:MAG TPA: hypothetical protein VK507_19465 [Iamia sp.]|nr:hypothetical protein [Iamia sp.]
MRFGRQIRLAVVGVVLVAGATACEPPAPTPPREAASGAWACAPRAYNSVTGPGMGTVNFYAGRLRKALLPAECAALQGYMAQAKAYAQQYPTRASAEAGGFRVSFEYFSGMGTHHSKNTFDEATINSPSFNRHDPILPGTATFDPTKPNTLQYDNDGPNAELVGMSWYIRSTTGPPAGFAGGVDWWHHHPRLCLSKRNPTIIGINGSDQGCSQSGGINLNMERYYMLHLWVVDDLEYAADAFAPMHPCIRYPQAIFDMEDGCHDVPNAPTPRGRPTNVPGTKTPIGFCPIGSNLPKL